MSGRGDKKKKSESERGSRGGAGAGRGSDFVVGSGVNYATILDHRVDDSRHERQKAYKAKELEEGLSLTSNSSQKKTMVSSTFDAFQRLATGKEGRKIADKIADPNRPTWEEYKKVNEDKLDMVGQEIRKMTEYRAELDKERERKLSERRGKKRKLYSDSEGEESGEGESDEEDEERKKKSKKEKKAKRDKKKKEKKSKKKRKKRSSHSSSSESEGESEGEGSAASREQRSGREELSSPPPSSVESGEVTESS